MYINVCSFSFVKGIIQQYKTAEKQIKTREKESVEVAKGQPHGSSGDNKFHGNTRELEVL